MKIIPAIDILDGKCVRLSQGKYSTKRIYSHHPVDVALAFEDSGIQHLHVVDLDGAKSNSIINHRCLKEIASQTSLEIDFGGGLKADKDLSIAFESGASKVTIGSISAKDPQLVIQWVDKYGSEKIILGADCRDRKITTYGWTENSKLEIVEFIQKFEKEGFREVICTDVSKDGMLEGPSLELYKDILKNTSVELIASGGVSSINDLENLRSIGCSGAIIGKAIYEDRITLKQLADLC